MRAVDPAGSGEPSASAPSERPPLSRTGRCAPAGWSPCSTRATARAVPGRRRRVLPAPVRRPGLEGFDWGDVGFEEASGVKWGSYALTGTFDGTTFTATDAIPAALYDAMAEPQDEPLAPRATSPATTDTAKATPEDLDATLAAASALPDVRDRVADRQHHQRRRHRGRGRRREHRCARPGAARSASPPSSSTDADLNAINQELQAALGDQLLTSGSFAPDSLDAAGRLRRRLDPGVGRRDVRRGAGAGQLGAGPRSSDGLLTSR